MVELAKALVNAQSEMGAALKDSKNPFFKSKYADLNAIIDASVPVLNKHGISVLQPTTTVVSNSTTGETKSVVRTILLHTSGELLSSDTDIICSKPNDPQAMGSAISYARRYGLQAFVVLKAEDDDGNAGSGKTEVKTSGSPQPQSGTTAAGNIETGSAKRVSFARKSAPQPTQGDDI